jgi:hypothetical protein
MQKLIERESDIKWKFSVSAHFIGSGGSFWGRELCGGSRVYCVNIIDRRRGKPTTKYDTQNTNKMNTLRERERERERERVGGKKEKGLYAVSHVYAKYEIRKSIRFKVVSRSLNHFTTSIHNMKRRERERKSRAEKHARKHNDEQIYAKRVFAKG